MENGIVKHLTRNVDGKEFKAENMEIKSAWWRFFWVEKQAFHEVNLEFH